MLLIYKKNMFNYVSVIYNFFLDESDDEDILTIKRKNIDIDDIPMIENEDKKALNKKKSVTKVALAKKILKKKIVPNKKTTFDDEGQVRIILL